MDNDNTQRLDGRQGFEEFMACSSEFLALTDRMRKVDQVHQVDFISSVLVKLQRFLVDHYNNSDANCFRGTAQLVRDLDRYTYMDMVKELTYGNPPAAAG
jgi:hypothetical protein